MAKFDKLEGDNLKQKEEYEGKIYALEKNHIRSVNQSSADKLFNHRNFMIYDQYLGDCEKGLNLLCVWSRFLHNIRTQVGDVGQRGLFLETLQPPKCPIQRSTS